MSKIITAEKMESLSKIRLLLDDETNDVPLNKMTLRRWDLNNNNNSTTFFDRLIAAPSDDELIIMWSIWAIITFISACISLYIFIPVLCTKKTRRNPFNLYLLFFYLSDMILGFSGAITKVTNAIYGSYKYEMNCKMESFYVVFSTSSNVWMNCVVVYELYTMLSNSKRCIRYKPPTTQKVLLQAFGVYTYCAMVASLCYIGNVVSWFPHKTKLIIGITCVPIYYDIYSTIFYYIIFLPLYVGIPISYVIYVIHKMLKDQLLPKKGKRRTLWIYFIRLAIVLFAMWIPAVLLFFLFGAFISPWVQWFGGAWGLSQGIVSALVSLLKPDIMNAVQTFWLSLSSLLCCCFYNSNSSSPGFHYRCDKNKNDNNDRNNNVKNNKQINNTSGGGAPSPPSDDNDFVVNKVTIDIDVADNDHNNDNDDDDDDSFMDLSYHSTFEPAEHGSISISSLLFLSSWRNSSSKDNHHQNIFFQSSQSNNANDKDNDKEEVVNNNDTITANNNDNDNNMITDVRVTKKVSNWKSKSKQCFDIELQDYFPE